MSTEILIYKYPNIIRLYESNTPINPICLNPHANLIEFFRENVVENNQLISRHPSNEAVKMMMKNLDIINVNSLVHNPNPKIGQLLERTMHKFTRDTWEELAKSHNRASMAFLAKHPKKINWTILSANPSDGAIRILKNDLDKVVWFALSANPSAIEILQNNIEEIDWWMLCMNPNAISIIENNIIENNMDRVYFEPLSANPNAIHIISQNLDKVSPFFLSKNPNAMDILINNPRLIDFNCIMSNPSAIPYLQTQIERIQPRHLFDLMCNPNSIPLIQLLLELDIISEDDLTHRGFMNNNSVYELNYQEMSKVRAKKIYYESCPIIMHPSNVQKCIDYHIDNGGSVDDFEMF